RFSRDWSADVCSSDLGPQRVALATCGRLPRLAEDDRLLLDPLERLGVRAEPVVWDAVGVDWGVYDAVVIRSCWDYYHRMEEFLEIGSASRRERVSIVV